MNATSVEAELRRELRWLKRGGGLSLARVRTCPTVLNLEIVQAAAAANNVGQAEAALQLLKAAARNIAGRPGTALRYAWSVDFKGRAEHLGGRRTALGIDTTINVGEMQKRRLENEAIEEVIAGFLDFQPRDHPRPLALALPNGGGKTLEGQYASGGFTLDFVNITYTVVKRRPTEWHQDESLRATIDGVAGVTSRYAFTGDPKDVTVHVWQGGKLGTQFPPTEFGIYAYNIEFPETLRKGKSHLLRHSRRIKGSKKVASPWVGFGPVGPTDHLVIRVQFVGELPSRVETRIGLAMCFPSPLESPEEVQVGPDGIAEYAFEDVVSGWGYGLEWSWESA